MPFVHLIHSVNRLKVLQKINKQAANIGRTMPCLLQIHIVEEETKADFDYAEVKDLLSDANLIVSLGQIPIKGLMGINQH